MKKAEVSHRIGSCDGVISDLDTQQANRASLRSDVNAIRTNAHSAMLGKKRKESPPKVYVPHSFVQRSNNNDHSLACRCSAAKALKRCNAVLIGGIKPNWKAKINHSKSLSLILHCRVDEFAKPLVPKVWPRPESTPRMAMTTLSQGSSTMTSPTNPWNAPRPARQYDLPAGGSGSLPARTTAEVCH